jgi:hypothetical protein
MRWVAVDSASDPPIQPLPTLRPPRADATSPSDIPHTLRRGRGLPGLILVAAHRACDEELLDLATRLLHLGEEALQTDPDPRRRRLAIAALIAAYERLWHLKHRNPDSGSP